MYPEVDSPSQIKTVILSAIGGGAVVTFVGFMFGGWVTGSTAAELARQRADKAVIVALAPICVEKFRQAPNADDNLGRLKGQGYGWDKGAAYVSKGGWARLPENTEPYLGVAQACADMLSKL